MSRSTHRGRAGSGRAHRGRPASGRAGAAHSLAVVAIAALLTGCAPAADRGSTDPGGSVTVFAAASLTGAFDEIAAAFEAEYPGVDVVLNFGGSPGLAEQVVQGAPADVFASASGLTMTRVTDTGLAVDPVDFATNTLEIATPPGNPGGVSGLSDFGRQELLIAICAVEVPCGAAAKAVFAAAGVEASVDTFEQDVKAVLAKVELGEVDAGLVYRTDVRAAGNRVNGVPFDGADAAASSYPIVALTAAPNPSGAEAFVAWVLSAAGQQILGAAGFGAP